jgi:hypothetical protein
MRKHLLFIVGLSSIVFFSCTEKIPVVSKANTTVLQDTSYVDAVQTPEQRSVLVEEATGVKCTNCPAGAAILKQIEADNEGKVVILGEHGGKLSDPIKGYSRDTFDNATVLQLFTNYFGGEPDKPSAAIDRMIQSTGNYFEYKEKWAFVVSQRVGVPTSLNLSVSSVYNDEADEFVVTVKGAYTKAVAKKQLLNMVVLEDSIIDAQAYPTYDDSFYVHNHVLREFISDYMGNPLLDEFATKEAGRTFIKSFVYKIPEDKKGKWNVNHMRVAVFVNNNEIGDREVQQAAEAHLKP